jgi:hypothetical protein
MKTLQTLFVLIPLLLFGCHSMENKTEERARERIKEFIFMMATDRFEEAEGMLSSDLSDSESKEVFLSNFDNSQLKDTTDIIVDVSQIYMPPDDPKNRAMVSMTVRSEKNDFTKIISMPIRYEKGNWYIGS